MLALAGVLAAALLGAFLFGLWHVLFGGLVKGNWRAGGFGVALAGGTAVAMVLEVAIVRRWLASGGAPKGPCTGTGLGRLPPRTRGNTSARWARRGARR